MVSMKIIGKGAEAYIYSTKLFGKEVIVKRRMRKNYRIEALDESIRAARTKREVKVMYLLGKLDINAPKPIAFGKYDIYMSKVDGPLLRDYKHKNAQMFRVVGSVLGKMHNNNIVHGDFTPVNIVVSKGKICLIDFGFSSITNSVEDKAFDLLLMKRAISNAEYENFLAGYISAAANSRMTIARASKIEKMGRYQKRTIDML
ncbi:MAG: KEOPS complex kinase/ATPase Bud32 [Candidatus Micrarchaeia archaeon]